MVCDNPAVVNRAMGGEGQGQISLQLLSAEPARKHGLYGFFLTLAAQLQQGASFWSCLLERTGGLVF